MLSIALPVYSCSSCHTMVAMAFLSPEFRRSRFFPFSWRLETFTGVAALHVLRRDAGRARQIVTEIRALDPENGAIRKIEELLERRSRRGR